VHIIIGRVGYTKKELYPFAYVIKTIWNATTW